MKTINFDYTGGFPLEQPVLKRMQSATLLVLEASVKQLGCADIGNYIISGCTISGANITPGIMYIDGELCPFAGAVGTASTKIKKQTNTLTAPFENGTNPPVFIETIAVVDATGTELQNFIKFYYVQDANYVHTENNFTAALLAKLNAIEALAQKNVQTDWNVTNPLSDAFLLNKPSIPNILKKSSIVLGPYNSNTTITVNFPDVGTSNYMVLINIESLNPFNNQGQDILAFFTSDHTPTSFNFGGIAPINSGVRNIKLNYLLIEL